MNLDCRIGSIHYDIWSSSWEYATLIHKNCYGIRTELYEDERDLYHALAIL